MNVLLLTQFSEHNAQVAPRNCEVSKYCWCTCLEKNYHRASMSVFMQLAKDALRYINSCQMLCMQHGGLQQRAVAGMIAGVRLGEREMLGYHNWGFADDKSDRIVERGICSFGFLYRLWWNRILPYATIRSRRTGASHGFVKSTPQGGNLSTVTDAVDVRVSGGLGPLSRVTRYLYGSPMPAIRAKERVFDPSSLLSVRQPPTDPEPPTCIDVPIRPGGVFVPRFRKAESLGENSARRRCRG
jgi:hypothetical protein